jgi:ubiquinone/menaquinone biosynthesis C-methylase UbiE
MFRNAAGRFQMRTILVACLKGLNAGLRKVTAFTHYAQYAAQWGFPPRPEWFDHYLDQHWQWSATNNSLWVERGVFSRLVMKPQSKLLEICCGDGFNAKHFYSSRASSILALDFDKDAIPHAKRYNSAPNITYIQKDIREGLPAGPFDNIIWDAAIEHFTEKEIDTIMSEIKARIGQDGILSGYTLTEAADGRKSNDLHEYEFKDKEDLRRFFVPHFKHVKVWETIYPTRHNLYFVASQAPLPVFDTAADEPVPAAEMAR